MLTFYPTLWAGSIRRKRGMMPDRHYLLPASSWARYRRKNGSIRPANLPDHLTRCAVDPGAFAAAHTGGYTYDFAQYLAWLHTFRPGQVEWAGTMDYCCIFCRTGQGQPPSSWLWVREASGGDQVREQQVKTSFMVRETFALHYREPFTWVPTCQGLNLDDYVWHAQDLRPLIAEMQTYYLDRDGPQSAFRVGIGSLCRPLPPGQLHAIIAALSATLPGVRFHLWGTKLGFFQRMRYALPEEVISCDSSMWHGARQYAAAHGDVPQRREKAWKRSGLSQTAYAYVHLPEYEAAIAAALGGRIRQQMLPLAPDEGASAQERERQRRLLYETGLEMALSGDYAPEDVPAPPDAYDWLLDDPDILNDWFIP
jgi:hypothetical protein